MAAHRFAGRSVLLLDLDGTLVDSAADITAALNATLEDYGRPAVPAATVRAMVGDGVAALLERAFAATGTLPEPAVRQAAAARCLVHYARAPAARTRIFSGALQALSRLQARGWRYGICTNKPEALARTVLETLGLSPLIEAVVGGDSPVRRKPDPAHPLATLARLGATPDQAVFLGDSRNDLLAGRAAGLPVILVSFGYSVTPAAELGADRVIDHFDELDAILGA